MTGSLSNDETRLIVDILTNNNILSIDYMSKDTELYVKRYSNSQIQIGSTLTNCLNPQQINVLTNLAPPQYNMSNSVFLSQFSHYDIFDVFVTLNIYNPHFIDYLNKKVFMYDSIEVTYELGPMYYSNNAIIPFSELEDEYYSTDAQKQECYKLFLQRNCIE